MYNVHQLKSRLKLLVVIVGCTGTSVQSLEVSPTLVTQVVSCCDIIVG